MEKAFLLVLFSTLFITINSNVFVPITEKKFDEIEFNFQKIDEKYIQPIILVPGLAGSSLNAKLDHADEKKWWCFKNSNWYRLWVNIFDAVPHLSAECLIHNLQPIFDPITKRFHNNKGVTIQPRNFGETEPVEYLTPYAKKLSLCFKPTVDYFVKAGYERGKSIRGAPYDFRLSVQELERVGWFNQLKELIEETYRINNNTKVHLIGHSLGGPITSFFLGKLCEQEWKDKYVSSYFALAPSFDGSIEALGALKSGKYSSIPMDISQVLKNLGGLIWMFPKKIDDDKIIVYSPHKNYTQKDMKELLTDMGFPETYPLYEHLSDPEYDPTRYPPGVNLHCMYGIGRKTATALYFKDPKERSDFQIAEYDDDGDCTVPKYSSAFCHQFQQKEKIDVHTFKGEAYKDTDFHRFLVGDKEILDSIFHLIYGNQ